MMITSMRGLYDEDSFWEYKPPILGPDTFEIGGSYKPSVEESHRVLKSLTSDFNGTTDSIEKVHKVFANSMTANFPYQLSGACGSICVKNTCKQIIVKLPSNIHILTSRHYEHPITENRFYNASLYSDGKLDSFTTRFQ